MSAGTLEHDYQLLTTAACDGLTQCRITAWDLEFLNAPVAGVVTIHYDSLLDKQLDLNTRGKGETHTIQHYTLGLHDRLWHTIQSLAMRVSPVPRICTEAYSVGHKDP